MKIIAIIGMDTHPDGKETAAQIATGSNVDRKLKALAEGLMEAANGVAEPYNKV